MQAQGKIMILTHPPAIYVQIPTHFCALIPDKHNSDDDTGHKLTVR